MRFARAALVALIMLASPSSAAPVAPPALNAWAAGDQAALLARAAAYTVAFRPPPRPVVHYAAVSHSWGSTGSVNGYPCGGSLPPCYVLARESGGNPTARNPRSTASGLWQFLDSTWARFAGYARAYLAPPDVQNDKARLVWANGAGCSHWSAC